MAESSDGFWAFGDDPTTTGDEGGAFQIEPSTWLLGAKWAGVNPANKSAGAQYRVAVALLRHDHGRDWTEDDCKKG